MARRYPIGIERRAPLGVTELRRRVLRAAHDHPELKDAGRLAEHLGDVDTWTVCLEIGAALVEGQITKSSQGYHLTKAGADVVGIGQLGLFGGMT
jgi:hypothetical protein